MPTSDPTPRPRRTGRKILLAFAVLLALLVLALAIVPAVISLDSLKGQITAQAEQALQRNVEIGQIRLQIFSGLGAGLEQLTVHNQPGWQQAHFVRVGTLTIKVAFWPLLQRRIEVSKIVLSDGNIIIERDAEGRTNYEDLMASQPSSETPAPSQPGTDTSSLSSLLVSRVSLENVNVSFVDRMIVPGETVTTTARDLRLDLSNIALNSPIEFDLATALLTDGTHNVRIQGRLGPVPASLAFNAVALQVKLEAQDVVLDKLVPYMGPEPALLSGRLGVNMALAGSLDSGLELDGTVILAQATMPEAIGQGRAVTLPEMRLKPHLRVDLARALLELKELRLDLPPLQATLKGSVKQFPVAPEFDLQLTTNDFATAEVLAALPMLATTASDVPVKAHVTIQANARGSLEQLYTNTRLSLRDLAVRLQDGSTLQLPRLGLHEEATIDLPNALIQLTRLEVDLEPLLLTLQGTIGRFTTAPQADLQLATNVFDPGRLVTQFPMLAGALPASSGLQGSMALQGSMQGTPGNLQVDTQLAIDALTLKSGASRDGTDGAGLFFETAKTQARVNLRLAATATPEIQVELHADRLVFDQRSDAASQAVAQPAGQAGSAAGSAAPPVNMRGKATIDQGTIKGMQFRQMVATFSLIQGLFKSDQTFQMFDGTYQGKVEVNLAAADPDYTAEMKLVDVNAGGLVSDLTSVNNVLLGVMNTDVAVQGKGFTWEAISQTLTGDVGVRISSLKLTTLDLLPRLAGGLSAVGAVAGFSVPEGLAERSFDTLQGAFRIEQGKMRTEKLHLSGKDVEVVARGVLGLDQSLDFKGDAFLLGALAASFGNKAAFLQDKTGRIQLPFVVRGTVTQPVVVPDEAYLMELAKKALLGQVGGAAGKTLQQLVPPSLSGGGGPAGAAPAQEPGSALRQLLPPSLTGKPGAGTSRSPQPDSKPSTGEPSKAPPSSDDLPRSLKGLFNR